MQKVIQKAHKHRAARLIAKRLLCRFKHPCDLIPKWQPFACFY